MKLPRSISGRELASLPRRHYGYLQVRQTGSHMRLVSHHMGYPDHVSVPKHDFVRIGTLADILNHVAGYVGLDKEDLAEQLFG